MNSTKAMDVVTKDPTKDAAKVIDEMTLSLKNVTSKVTAQKTKSKKEVTNEKEVTIEPALSTMGSMQDKIRVDAILSKKPTIMFDKFVTTLNYEEAEAMLKMNIHNRPIKDANVRNIATDMVNRVFTPNVDPIVFDKFGVLVNGQHRLKAIVLIKGVDIPCCIVVGFDRSYLRNVDCKNIRRTLTDRARLDGVDINVRQEKICSAVINTKAITTPDYDLFLSIYNKFKNEIFWASEHGGKNGKGRKEIVVPVLGVVVRALIIGYPKERLERFLSFLTKTFEGDCMDWRDRLVTNKFIPIYDSFKVKGGQAGKDIRAYTESVLYTYLTESEPVSKSANLVKATSELFPLELDNEKKS